MKSRRATSDALHKRRGGGRRRFGWTELPCQQCPNATQAFTAQRVTTEAPRTPPVGPLAQILSATPKSRSVLWEVAHRLLASSGELVCDRTSEGTHAFSYLTPKSKRQGGPFLLRRHSALTFVTVVCRWGQWDSVRIDFSPVDLLRSAFSFTPQRAPEALP